MHLKYVTFSRAENIANANFYTYKMYSPFIENGTKVEKKMKNLYFKKLQENG